MQVVGQAAITTPCVDASARIRRILLIDEAAGRRKAGHCQKIVADVGIGEAVQLMRMLEPTVTLARFGPARLRR